MQITYVLNLMKQLRGSILRVIQEDIASSITFLDTLLQKLENLKLLKIGQGTHNYSYNFIEKLGQIYMVNRTMKFMINLSITFTHQTNYETIAKVT